MEDTLRVAMSVGVASKENRVLILVLMEDTLRAKSSRIWRGVNQVLILVLMEDTLRG